MTCPIHMLSALCHYTGLVRAQLPVTASGDKPAAELATAPALIARLDWQGRVLTGDALYCQRALCQQVVDAGGDYLVLVKGNQPQLHRDLATLFAHRADTALNAASLPALDMRTATTDDHGHARTERRTLIASTDLDDYLNWPALAQVFTVERVWQERGIAKRPVRCGITSPPVAVANAARLLALKREHWGIENGLPYVKDVTLGRIAARYAKNRGQTCWRCCATRPSICYAAWGVVLSPRACLTTAAAYRPPRSPRPFPPSARISPSRHE